MLAHAEIVVRAPDRHLDRAARAVPGGPREVARAALQLSKHAVAAFAAEAVQLLLEERFVVHAVPLTSAATPGCAAWLSDAVRVRSTVPAPAHARAVGHAGAGSSAKAPPPAAAAPGTSAQGWRAS